MDIAILFSLGALICGAMGLLIALRILRSPPKWLPDLAKEVMKPGYLGTELRTAYPPGEVAGIISAVIDNQKPAMMDFFVDEGIPLMAKIGGGEVAGDARLAKAAGNLGGGAAGLQGLMGLVSAPSKRGGMGDLMQYLPMIKEFMGNQSGNGGQGPSLSPQQGSSNLGGKIGGR